jgi:hypothetical protein
MRMSFARLTDVGHLPKRDLRARGSADQYVGKVLKVAPVIAPRNACVQRSAALSAAEPL